MSVHDEWDRQRDVEAEGQRAAGHRFCPTCGWELRRAGHESFHAGWLDIKARLLPPEPELEVGRFEGMTFVVGSIPLEAVPLLLAVAKAGAFLSFRVNELTTSYPNDDDSWDDSWEHQRATRAMYDVFKVVETLDRAHPNWRDWA